MNYRTKSGKALTEADSAALSRAQRAGDHCGIEGNDVTNARIGESGRSSKYAIERDQRTARLIWLSSFANQ